LIAELEIIAEWKESLLRRNERVQELAERLGLSDGLLDAVCAEACILIGLCQTMSDRLDGCLGDPRKRERSAT
jgi:hypothetical protein